MIVRNVPSVRDGDNGGGYACVGGEGIWEISVLFSQYCCEHETALKKQSL